jgi:hypothetical protein
MQPHCLFSGRKTEFHGSPAAVGLDFHGAGAMLMIHIEESAVMLPVRQTKKFARIIRRKKK